MTVAQISLGENVTMELSAPFPGRGQDDEDEGDRTGGAVTAGGDQDDGPFSGLED